MEEEEDYTSYNIVSKRKSIEQHDTSNNKYDIDNNAGNIDLDHGYSNKRKKGRNDVDTIATTATTSCIINNQTTAYDNNKYDDSSYDSTYVVDIKKPEVKARFYSDIEEMMYGFGDRWPPLSDSVHLLDAIAVKYIQDLGE